MSARRVDTDDRGTLTRSRNGLNRLQVLNRVLERRLTQAKAAEQPGLSLRQIERLCRKLRLQGPGGLVSMKRGRPSNRRLPDGLREHAWLEDRTPRCTLLVYVDDATGRLMGLRFAPRRGQRLRS